MDLQLIPTPSLDFQVALNLGETASCRCIMRLVPAFILKTHSRRITKCLPKLFPAGNTSLVMFVAEGTLNTGK